jgi:hypothetical protein
MQKHVFNSLAQLVAQHDAMHHEYCYVAVDEHSVSMVYDDEFANVLEFTSTDELVETLAELLALELADEMCSMCKDLYYSSAAIQQLGERYEMEF